MIPIWKDHYFDIGRADSVEYSVLLKDGTSIYEGIAYKRPNDPAVFVKINDIVADYLANTLPTESQIATNATAMEIEVTVVADGKNLTETFRYDWSYEDYEGSSANVPICKFVDNRQPIIISTYSTESVRADFVYENGDTSYLMLPISKSRDFNIDYDNSFAKSALGKASANGLIDLREIPNLARVTANGYTYEVVGTCYRYALYYINARGGWDTLLIRGAYSVKDAIVRHNYTRDTTYRVLGESVAFARNKCNMSNDITRTYTLHTGRLTDEESARMHHLVESPEVLLYDLVEGRFIPVVLNDAELTHKTYKGNGGKFNDYEINAEVARTMTRR